MILEHFQIFSLFNEAFRPHFVSNLNFLYKNLWIVNTATRLADYLQFLATKFSIWYGDFWT